MYEADDSYEYAKKRIFRTLFFENRLPFKDKKVEYMPPRFLKKANEIQGTYWMKHFYNRKINIDYTQTIIVFDTRYEYYNNLPEELRFYAESYIETYSNNISWGTRFRKQYEI